MMLNTMSMHGACLSDDEWTRIQPLLPPQRPPTGRPAHDHRTIVGGILWVQRTGAPWRHMPRQYGAWSTVACRYHRWKRAGVWDRVQRALYEHAKFNSNEHGRDSASVSARPEPG